MPAVALTLISKPDCHLCDDARDVIGSVVAELGLRASDSITVSIDEKSILDDAELNQRYWDEIPVVLVNGKVHTIWRVDPARLRTAIEEAAG